MKNGTKYETAIILPSSTKKRGFRNHLKDPYLLVGTARFELMASLTPSGFGQALKVS
jgi:hypothetical protein